MKNEKIKKDIEKYSFQLIKEIKMFLKQIENNEGIVPKNAEIKFKYPRLYSYIQIELKNKEIFLNECLGKDRWKKSYKRVNVVDFIKIITINNKKYTFDNKSAIAKRCGIKTFHMKKLAIENNIIILPPSLLKITKTIISKSVDSAIKKEDVIKIKQKLLKDYKNKRWTPYITLYKKFGGLEGYIKYLGFKII